MNSVILVGAGGHAISSVEVIEKTNEFKIAGLIGLKSEIGKKILGYEIIGDDESLPKLRNTIEHAIVTVGQISSANIRATLFTTLQNLNFNIPTIISPFALVSTYSQIGIGTIVFHGARINAASNIGSNCIINTNAIIEHGAEIGNNCHISTGALVNGEVSIGPGTFVGSGAIIRDGVSIGANSVIGMGTRITKNLPPDAFVKSKENLWLQ